MPFTKPARSVNPDVLECALSPYRLPWGKWLGRDFEEDVGCVATPPLLVIDRPVPEHRPLSDVREDLGTVVSEMGVPQSVWENETCPVSVGHPPPLPLKLGVVLSLVLGSMIVKSWGSAPEEVEVVPCLHKDPD